MESFVLLLLMQIDIVNNPAHHFIERLFECRPATRERVGHQSARWNGLKSQEHEDLTFGTVGYQEGYQPRSSHEMLHKAP